MKLSDLIIFALLLILVLLTFSQIIYPDIKAQFTSVSEPKISKVRL